PVPSALPQVFASPASVVTAPEGRYLLDRVASRVRHIDVARTIPRHTSNTQFSPARVVTSQRGRLYGWSRSYPPHRSCLRCPPPRQDHKTVRPSPQGFRVAETLHGQDAPSDGNAHLMGVHNS